jgi:sulfhydrogenase subunit gamma (sulfur reductase)
MPCSYRHYGNYCSRTGGETIKNPYLPLPATIEQVVEEVGGERAIKTFRLVFTETKNKEEFIFKPGQCVMVGLLGVGECMFALSSSPTKKEYLEIGVMKHGKVTSALHNCKPGDHVGIRGPYGNNFPVDDWAGKNLVFIGGGIGQAPLRSVIQYVVDNRKKYRNIHIFYGARTSQDLCYKNEFAELEKHADINVFLSVDKEEKGWKGFTGFVPQNLMKVKPTAENSIAITCGPAIMIKRVIDNLVDLGFSEKQIFTTLEMRMKCGIGKCGRCNVGPLYVCKDGPVFSYDQLQHIKGER